MYLYNFENKNIDLEQIIRPVRLQSGLGSRVGIAESAPRSSGVPFAGDFRVQESITN
jgi:hypothetical protein